MGELLMVLGENPEEENSGFFSSKGGGGRGFFFFCRGEVSGQLCMRG
jgi:hypothetical protein